jgi:hypothetical protein
MSSLKIMVTAIVMILVGISLVIIAKSTSKVKYHGYKISMVLFTLSLLMLLGFIGRAVTGSMILAETEPYGPAIFGITLLIMYILIWIFSTTDKSWARHTNRILLAVLGVILIISVKVLFPNSGKVLSTVVLAIIVMTYISMELCLDSKDSDISDEQLGNSISNYGYILVIVGVVMVYTCKTCGEQGLGDVHSSLQSKLDKSKSKVLNASNIEMETQKLQQAVAGFGSY